MNLKRVLSLSWPLILLLMLFAAGFAVNMLSTEKSDFSVARTTVKAPASCRFDEKPCLVKAGEAAYQISVSGEVKPLQRFRISIHSAKIASASVSFTMVDMDMGVNLFVFSRSGEEQWIAEVVLPVCSARRTDWLAEISIKNVEGHVAKILYPFDVTI
jgi:hypothetical protein